MFTTVEQKANHSESWESGRIEVPKVRKGKFIAFKH